MRVLAFLMCMLTGAVSTIHAADDDDRAAVRKQGEQYTAFLRKGNKAGLEELFHKDYQGRSLPGVPILSRDKSQAIAHWLGRSFSHLKVEVDGIRLFGNTAIETGTMSAELKEYGSGSTWSKLGYTRVWVRDGKSWRLVHEQF